MSITFSELLNDAIQLEPEHWSIEISDDWMQGRTTYGGLSTAICLNVVENTYPELPPLRSAQINFTGPAGGRVSVNTKIMRQGRSVTYISAEMVGEKGLATHAVFCFGASRESRLNNAFTTSPQVPPVSEASPYFGESVGPEFTKNFDCLLAKGDLPFIGSSKHEHFTWARHKDPQANDMAALLGVADMPPPAVFPMFTEFAPISSMTWMMNVLSDNISTQDGWWLMRSAAEHARDGYSSQDMQIWNTNGELVISGRQNVAIFY